MKTMLMKLTAPMILGAVVVTAGVIIYAMVNDYEIEVNSPFFGSWKLKKKTTA